MQQTLLRDRFWLLINLVKAESAHDEHWYDELEEGAEPGSSPVDAVFAS